MLPSGPPRPAPTAAAPSLDARTESQLDMWVEAKRKRDFHTADRIRSELESRGIKPEVARPHVWEPPGAGRVRGAHGRGEALGPPPLPSTFGAGGFGKEQKRSDDAPKLPPGIDTSIGDWHCVACGNWNWARRKECNQCNAAKDGLVNVKGAASGTKRLGEGGGFKEFDEEEDAKRKRRALEHQREKEERKAEKKKCKFCSRFSCIC